jgi:hypothetical protein
VLDIGDAVLLLLLLLSAILLSLPLQAITTIGLDASDIVDLLHAATHEVCQCARAVEHSAHALQCSRNKRKKRLMRRQRSVRLQRPRHSSSSSSRSSSSSSSASCRIWKMLIRGWGEKGGGIVESAWANCYVYLVCVESDYS